MKIAVISFPGSNCDRDMVFGLEQAGFEPELVWHSATALDSFAGAVVPGGFSYGDYLRAGALAKFSPVMAPLAEMAAQGLPVLGVCNGFQILTEAGLLPGALLPNIKMKFLCQPVFLRVEQPGLGLEPGEVFELPIAHGEGCYYAAPEVLAGLEASGQIALRYCSPAGELSDAWNPNGSLAAIAGVSNSAGNVLGMMPHPERYAHPALGSAVGQRFLRGFLERR
jgi:phosphoribosylformylglycinamidine synthase